MSSKYVPCGSQARPTREEAIETIFEAYIALKRDIKKLENIYKREYSSRRKQFLKNK